MIVSRQEIRGVQTLLKSWMLLTTSYRAGWMGDSIDASSERARGCQLTFQVAGSRQEHENGLKAENKIVRRV
jgi:hypothetical protein